MPQFHRCLKNHPVVEGGPFHGLVLFSSDSLAPGRCVEHMEIFKQPLGVSHLAMLSLAADVGPGFTLPSHYPTLKPCLSAFTSAVECVTFVFFTCTSACLPRPLVLGGDGGQTPFCFIPSLLWP